MFLEEGASLKFNCKVNCFLKDAYESLFIPLQCPNHFDFRSRLTRWVYAMFSSHTSAIEQLSMVRRQPADVSLLCN